MLQFLTYLFIAIYTATVIGIILVVILGNRNPLKTIPWVVVLIFAPVVGLVFYFFFGQDLRRKPQQKPGWRQTGLLLKRVS